MANVSVSTLAEFIAAIAVEGNTVVCPENAVWDANDTYPDGYQSDIVWNASVTGNGTTIKNLRIYGFFRANNEYIHPYIDGLRIIDLIGSSASSINSGDPGLFEGNFHFTNTAISAVLNAVYKRLVRWFSWSSDYLASRCSFNIDASGNFDTFGMGKVQYSRIELHLPNSVWYPYYANFDKCYESEIIIYAPNAGGLHSLQFVGCVIHGEMPNTTETATSGSWDGDMTVYSTDAMPNFVPRDPVHFVGVTDAQLRDPSYLRGIGFPIAIEVSS